MQECELKIQRWIEQVQRCRNGLEFGIVYTRSKWFNLPTALNIAGTNVPISYPSENGVLNDFMGCIIRDDYGLRRVLGQVRTIVDIGANVGFFALAARHLFPHAAIHAYEPNPRILPYLKRNVMAAGIQVFGEAVGRQDGRVRMVDWDDSNQARVRTAPEGEIDQVGLHRVIARIGSRIDLLKLDCEGAEWDMLASKECWSSIDHIRMEYHLDGNHSFNELAETLQSSGFHIVRHVPEQGYGTVWASTRGSRLLEV